MKYAVRQLIRHPGFTVVALVTLALGIGINTTAFSVLNRLVLQTLPFHDPSSLVQVWMNSPREGRSLMAPADYFDLKEQNTVFTDVASYQQGQPVSYAEPGKPAMQSHAVFMTANFFSILGVVPELGRLPTPEESRTHAFVCLISDTFWRQQFNADPNVIGRTVRVSSRPSTVIGVLPPFLDEPSLFGGQPAFFYLDPVTESRSVRNVGWEYVVARTKPAVSFAQARAGVEVVAKRLALAYPSTNQERAFQVIPFPTNQLGEAGAHLSWMMAALSGLVLLIACVNLANLQIVRATGRSHEVAIRLALGCSRGRLVGIFLLESMVLALVGGGFGLLVAAWSNVFVARYFKINLPIDLHVIAYVLAASLGTALLFGTAPAWLALRGDLGARLKSNSRGTTHDRTRRSLSRGLVLIELSLALTLLAGASFFVSGIFRLTHRNLGWEVSHEVLAVVPLDQDHFGGDKVSARHAFANQALAALRALPGVQYASISAYSPSWGGEAVHFTVEGRPPPSAGHGRMASYMTAGPNWLDVFGMRLIAGREFTEADTMDSPPVAIVSESMAQAMWPGKSALGKRIAPDLGGDQVWLEVVGVVKDFQDLKDFRGSLARGAANLRILRPWAQESSGGVVLAVRTAVAPGLLKDSIRKALAPLVPDVALNYDATIDEDSAATYSYFTFLRRALLQISVLGLLLAAVGLYGIVANLASERTREIGIRMALGAQPGNILWLFLRGGVSLAMAGAALGLIGSCGLTISLERIVPDLPGRNPWGLASAAAVLVTVATVACWLPARRATKVSPMVALRVE